VKYFVENRDYGEKLIVRPRWPNQKIQILSKSNYTKRAESEIIKLNSSRDENHHLNLGDKEREANVEFLYAPVVLVLSSATLRTRYDIKNVHAMEIIVNKVYMQYRQC